MARPAYSALRVWLKHCNRSSLALFWVKNCIDASSAIWSHVARRVLLSSILLSSKASTLVATRVSVRESSRASMESHIDRLRLFSIAKALARNLSNRHRSSPMYGDNRKPYADYLTVMSDSCSIRLASERAMPIPSELRDGAVNSSTLSLHPQTCDLTFCTSRNGRLMKLRTVGSWIASFHFERHLRRSRA